MNLKNQKRVAADLLKVGSHRVSFDTERLSEIKEAITKADLRALINDGAIKANPVHGISRGRARKNLSQKRKGRRKGEGSREGKRSTKRTGKRRWINAIRAQREFILMLKDKGLIDPKVYRDLYRKAKGGFFRSRRHINLYLTDRDLLKQDKKETNVKGKTTVKETAVKETKKKAVKKKVVKETNGDEK